MSKKNTGAFMMGTVLGGLVGAGIALLYAPQSGENTRQVIKEKSIELKDKAIETGDELRHKAEDVSARAMERIEETAEATKTRAQEFQSRSQSFLDEQRNRIKTALDAGRKPAVETAEALVENGVEMPEPAA